MSVSIIASSKGGSQSEPIEAGTYFGRCYSMVHLGTLKEEYLGEVKLMNKVRLTFELPTELKVFKEENGEQPCVISKEFTLSLSEKSNLLKFLNSWRGVALSDAERQAFDIVKLVGAPCMITISHKTSATGKTYAEISGIGKVMKGMEVPPQVNPSVVFSVNQFDPLIFATFPDFIKDKISSSAEYQAMKSNAPVAHVEDAMATLPAEEEEDGLPF